MLTKQKVLHLILALLKGGDGELLRNGSVLSRESCSDVDKEKIVEIGRLIEEIYSSYDYLLSPEFSKLVAGKSDKYYEMKMNIESNALNKKKHKEEFFSAIRELLRNKSIYDLVAISDHGKVNEVLRLLSELNLEQEEQE
jgi:hypothetical protein